MCVVTSDWNEYIQHEIETVYADLTIGQAIGAKCCGSAISSKYHAKEAYLRVHADTHTELVLTIEK